MWPSICLRVQSPWATGCSSRSRGNECTRRRNSSQLRSMRSTVSRTAGWSVGRIAVTPVTAWALEPLLPRRPALQVAEELGARAVSRPEETKHGGRRHDRTGLPNSAHYGAQVVGLDDHADALWRQALVEEVGDLLVHPRLDLEPPCVHLDHPRDLRQADDATARDVRHRRRAEERQQVVLAQ